MTKKTIPNSELKYFVPKIWATIPLVGGTVDSHNIPKVIPNNTDINNDGGEKINIEITIALKKYRILNNIFLEYLVPK